MPVAAIAFPTGAAMILERYVGYFSSLHVPLDGDARSASRSLGDSAFRSMAPKWPTTVSLRSVNESTVAGWAKNLTPGNMAMLASDLVWKYPVTSPAPRAGRNAGPSRVP